MSKRHQRDRNNGAALTRSRSGTNKRSKNSNAVYESSCTDEGQSKLDMPILDDDIVDELTLINTGHIVETHTDGVQLANVALDDNKEQSCLNAALCQAYSQLREYLKLEIRKVKFIETKAWSKGFILKAYQKDEIFRLSVNVALKLGNMTKEQFVDRYFGWSDKILPSLRQSMEKNVRKGYWGKQVLLEQEER